MKLSWKFPIIILCPEVVEDPVVTSNQLSFCIVLQELNSCAYCSNAGPLPGEEVCQSPGNGICCCSWGRSVEMQNPILFLSGFLLQFRFNKINPYVFTVIFAGIRHLWSTLPIKECIKFEHFNVSINQRCKKIWVATGPSKKWGWHVGCQKSGSFYLGLGRGMSSWLRLFLCAWKNNKE